MRFEQVQRFILAKKIFWGEGHFKGTLHVGLGVHLIRVKPGHKRIL